MKTLCFNVPADAWEDNGPADDPKRALLAALEINGCMLHLEAHQVRPANIQQEQKLLDTPDWVTAALYGSSDYDDVQTVKIGRRHYVLIATPYAA